RWRVVCLSFHLGHRAHRLVPQVPAFLAAPPTKVATLRPDLVIRHVAARVALLAVEEETNDRGDRDTGSEPQRGDLPDRTLGPDQVRNAPVHQLTSFTR